MFDKEAEEIANKRCHEIMCYGHCSFNSPKHHRCGEWHREYNCALEGIKAGRPQWHDAKNGDLPNGSCLVFYKDTSGVNSYSVVHPSWYIAGIKAFFENNPRIIAWCEIPSFDKE